MHTRYIHVAVYMSNSYYILYTHFSYVRIIMPFIGLSMCYFGTYKFQYQTHLPGSHVVLFEVCERSTSSGHDSQMLRWGVGNINALVKMMGVSQKIGFFSPHIIHGLIRFFHYFHHPFWGTTIFWKYPYATLPRFFFWETFAWLRVSRWDFQRGTPLKMVSFPYYSILFPYHSHKKP